MRFKVSVPSNPMSGIIIAEMKIVFCDIDGVLNSELGFENNGVSGIEEDKLSLLKSLLDKTEGELVITSKMRFKSMQESRLKTIKEAGIAIKDAFQSDPYSVTSKAAEVLGYLQNKAKGCQSFIVLDDNDDGFTDSVGDRFLKINARTGLTKEDVEKAIALLNRV